MDYKYLNQTQRSNSQQNLNFTQRKVEKDDKGYILVKPTQTTSVLKEVIVTQKEKIDALNKEKQNMESELQVREDHIKNMQAQMAEMLEVQKMLQNNLAAFKYRSATSLKLADGETRVQILEEELNRRLEAQGDFEVKFKELEQENLVITQAYNELEEKNKVFDNENNKLLKENQKLRDEVQHIVIRTENQI